MIVKPASQTPLTALGLGVLAVEAGIPKGVLQIVTGKSSVVGEVLTGSDKIRKFSFTGSTETGAMLMAQCAPTIKKVSFDRITSYNVCYTKLLREHVSLSETGIPARIEAVDYHGADTVVSTRIGDQRLQIRIAGHFVAPKDGEVRLAWPFEAVHLFEAESGRRADLPPKPAKGNPQCSVV